MPLSGGFHALSSGNISEAICVPLYGRPSEITCGFRECRNRENGAKGSLEQDAQLVQQCLQGDGSAWEELVRRHTRRIYNICYRFVGNRTEAEDLSQEVFLRVYRTLVSYRSAHGGFVTWMTSVTRNLLIDHYRRTKRDRITDSLDDAMQW